MGIKGKIKLKRLLPTLVVAIAIFGLGWGIGAQKIGPGSVFHKSQNKSLSANLNYSSVEQLYDSLRTSYDGQLDQTKLLDGIKNGLVNASGDPYTEYLNAKDAKSFDDELNGTFTGIGAELTKDTTTKNIVVISPISGFPADKAGLKAQDIIEQIDGTNANGLSISQAVDKIRGPKGTQVKLKILRDGTQELTLDITRDQITVPSVESKVLPGNIGYIKITTFSQDTGAKARLAAQQLKDAGVKGIVLDVRGDPGGLLDAAVDTAGLWLNNKVVLREKRGNSVIHTYTSSNGAILNGLPTVVLIDGGSASASEILAGALKDNGAATLIGVKSFGKGSVQQVIQLIDGSELKVTVARWYTPNDKNIDKQGIEPDQKIDRSNADITSGKDPQLDAATQFLSK